MEIRSSRSMQWDSLDASKRALLQQRLQTAAEMSHRTEAAAVMTFDARREFPLSSAQQRIWLMEKITPGTPTFNLAEVFRFRGKLNIHALLNSISELINRHASLRTVFFERDGEPVQQVRPPTQVFSSVTALRGERKNQEGELQAIISGELHRPFDLQNGPLIRIRLLKFNDCEHVLVIAMHHIITDGWSNSVLVNEMFECYRNFVHNERPNLTPQRFKYSDFVDWQHSWLNKSEYSATLNYWRQKLAGLLEQDGLKAEVLPVHAAITGGAVKRFSIPDELCIRLRELSRNEGATLFMSMLAAYKVLLHRYTRNEDIRVGSPVANRNRLEFEGVVGCFLNMLVLRTNVNGIFTFRQVLQQVRDTALEAYSHQDMPFERLVMELRPPRTSKANPFFQVAFMFENFPTRQTRLPGLDVSRIVADTNTSKFDLTLVLAPEGDTLAGAFEYRTDSFSPDSIDRLIEDYCSVLQNVTANPNLRVSQLL